MISLLSIYFLFLGLIIGSFLNVIIFRHNTGKTIGGRSSCMSCKTKLTWKELIPVFSFLFQKGRCKTCHTKLHIQYPIIELITGILFLLNFHFWLGQMYSYTDFIFGFGITTTILALYVVMFVYDLRHKIIPDVFSLSAWVLSIVYVVIKFKYSLETLIYIGTGFVFYVIIWTIWKLSKGRMIGLGDAKLLLSIGTILGGIYTLSAVFVATWIGTIYVAYILLKQSLRKMSKHITMKTEIPFGPFLILGFLIVYFTNIDVTNIGTIIEIFYEK